MALKATTEDIATFRGDWISWFEYMCNTTFDNEEDFYNCVYTKMYNRDEIIIKNSVLDFETTLMTNVSVPWENFTDSVFHGNCQTMRTFGNMEEGKYLKVFLNPKIIYRAYIHDTNFFVTSMNPSGTPKLEIPLNFAGQVMPASFQYIYAEKHQLLNREGFQCTDYDQIGSSFSDCIAVHVSNLTHCKVSFYSL